MPARKRPAPEDAVTARQTLLDGLARDADVFELLSELAPLHPRDNAFPGEVFLHDFWQYALFAAVAYVRATASRAGVPVRQACQDLALSPGHPAP